MKTQRMKMTFFLIRDQSLHIFQCTGKLCLTMTLQYRYIDKEIQIHRLITKLQFQSFAVPCMKGILLRIHKRDPVLTAEVQISTDFRRFGGFIPNPGALQDQKIRNPLS